MLFPGGLHDDVQHSGRELAEAFLFGGAEAATMQRARMAHTLTRESGSVFTLASSAGQRLLHRSCRTNWRSCSNIAVLSLTAATRKRTRGSSQLSKSQHTFTALQKPWRRFTTSTTTARASRKTH